MGRVQWLYKRSGYNCCALLDEYFPVFYDNEWYFNEFYKATDQNLKSMYRLSVGYYCVFNDDSQYPDYIPHMAGLLPR